MPKPTRHALAPPPRSTNGAAPDPALNLFGVADTRPPLVSTPADDSFLPELCQPKSVLAIVLVAELLAIVLALASTGAAPFLTSLARISLFVQWLALTSAAVLCYSRSTLCRLSVPQASAAVFGLLLTNAAILTIIAQHIANRIDIGALDGAAGVAGLWPFLLRNLGITLIVTAVLLRYFFVAHQWRRHVRAEARSRIAALQARIRPHFLFNSMNTIAALTRSDPRRAEEAVEDLADLFRATLGDEGRLLRLKEELELSRLYQRMEELRLGPRLRVDWTVGELPMRALVPGLTIQPLLENAIYHGIEPLEGGGTVTVSGRLDGADVELSVTNPVTRLPYEKSRTGNRLALDNIRQRLMLAYGSRGRLDVAEETDSYTVTIRFPYDE